MQASLSDCVLARWQPGFNDPYLTGWVMAGIYLLAAAAAGNLAVRAPFPAETRRQERVFWGLSAVFLAGLALNKQTDLQTLILSAGRCAAQAQGWFEHRRLVQRIAVYTLGAAALGGGAWLMWRLRRRLRHLGPALLGLSLTMGFVIARAATLFHIEAEVLTLIVKTRWPARIFEASGPLVMLGAALALMRPLLPRNRPAP